MRIALADLSLQGLVVIYPGTQRYRLAPTIMAVPAAEMLSLSWRDFG
jgi:hypothetical protein